MDFLGVVLPTIMYMLGIVLLVCLIVLTIKSINVVDKTNVMLDDVNKKIKSFDELFNAVNIASSFISSFGDKILEKISSIMSIFTRKRKNKEIFEEEGEEDLYE